MSILPPSLRPGEQVVLPGSPANFSIRRENDWVLVQNSRVWKSGDIPGEGPLFSDQGEQIAPDLDFARSRTDATLLQGDASPGEVQEWAARMHTLGPRTVCVFPAFLPQVLGFFPKPAVVISFPHGADSTRSKVLQSEESLQEGAGELDIVAPLRLIRDEKWKEFSREMRELAQLGAPVKLILETSLWNNDQTERASKLALEEGIGCLKTSTGHLGGATQQAIEIFARAGATEIKASGGVRSRLIAGEMLQAGATILGSSNMEEWN